MSTGYKFALGVILFVTLVFGAFAAETLASIDERSQDTSDLLAATQCSDRLVAEFAAAAGRALAAPPAPNDERLLAVEEILAASVRLDHSSDICGPDR